MEVLWGLSWLHVAGWAGDGPPPLGADTALISQVADLRATADDACGEDCPERGGPPHSHIQVNVGRGLLGVLEQFARDDEATGVRTYVWPTGRARKKVTKGKGKSGGEGEKKPTLRSVGSTGRLATFYLPAVLGRKAVCDSFTPAQRRLLQAVVRETTRSTRSGPHSPPKAGPSASDGAVGPCPPTAPNEGDEAPAPGAAAVITGGRVKDTNGKKLITIPALSPDKAYVTFGGNRALRGRGYKLTTEGGWLYKGGYEIGDVGAFLADLAALAGPLGLVVVGLHHPTQEVLSLAQLRGLALTPAGRAALHTVHLRMYTGDDFLGRWNDLFGWCATAPQQPLPQDDPVQRLLSDMAHKGVSSRRLALGIEEDPSFLAKVLKNRKPMPDGLLEKARAWLTGQGEPSYPPPVEVALDYLGRGWSVVPQLPGAKKPTVTWKPYQEERPTEARLMKWWQTWPQAGVAVILGPVSNLFAIDVDGSEAYQVLIDRLGGEPVAPKALSGSGQPDKCHFYFKCPALPTKAKQTPWHPKLEFRGHRGIIIAPPSVHRSGRRYVWAKGRTLDDVPLPEVPPQVLEALKPAKPTPAPTPGKPQKVPDGLDAAPSTRRFLEGRYADGPRWNDRLFRAACDLNGRGYDLAEAEPLLLAGAQPWNLAEEEAAMRTIQSAYSQERQPGTF
jgi:hypothetical protein